MKACRVFLLTWNQNWLRLSSFDYHKHPSVQENPECDDTALKVQDEMWCEVAQVWIQSFNKGKRMPSKSGKQVQRGGKEKIICSQYRMAKQPRYLLWQMCWLYPTGHTLRSSCLFMLQDVTVDSREPNERRAWTLTHLNHRSIEHLFSGSTLSNSALINPVHDEILDTWFLFSHCTTWSQ